MAGPFTVGHLASHLGGQVEGDASRMLRGVCGLREAGPEHLSFLSNRRYVRHLEHCQAGAILMDLTTDARSHTVIRLADPYTAFAQALLLFHPQQRPPPGVHPQAYVAPDAQVEGATIEALAYVGAGATVGAGSWVQGSAYVGPGATVGVDCTLMAHSVVTAGCTVGDRVWLNPGAVVGGEGFGFAPSQNGHTKIPHIGTARIEDDVEIGSNSCVDRATIGETVVRRGAKLDNLVQVGHAAEVGENTVMVAYSGVAGSSRLGRGVTMAAKAAVLGHIEIGDGVQVGVCSAVHDDQPAGTQVTGVPAIPHRTWLRAATAFKDLPDMIRQLRAHEQRLAVLETEPKFTRPTPRFPASGTIELPTPDSEGKRKMEASDILKILPHRFPFVLIDRVLEVEPGVSAVGVKCVTISEPWFQGHFPDQPIFPGVLLAEAFAQMAGIVALSAHPDFAGKAVYLMGLDGIRFRKPVVPGDRVIISCTKTYEKRNIWKFAAKAEVDGKKVADGEVMATVADRDSI